MNKLESAKQILKEIGIPKINDLIANTILALAKLGDKTPWEKSTNNLYTTRQIMDFMEDEYSIMYKPNTRETLRKDALHTLLNFGVVEVNKDEPSRATNSPKYCYSLTDEFLQLIITYNKKNWKSTLKNYLRNRDSLADKYLKQREESRIKFSINETSLSFSPGDHNVLQKEILNKFIPIFAQGAEVLYVGDTENKSLYKKELKLKKLGIDMENSPKLPDIILYLEKKNWIFFIEAVTSVGPINDKRIIELGEISKESSSGIVYVTAFLNILTFKKFASEIAWETEVWIAENPEHMLHYNGDRFLGPR